MTERQPTHGVVVIGEDGYGGFAVRCGGDAVQHLSKHALHPLPPSLTPQAAAVLEAAVKWRDPMTDSETVGIMLKAIDTYRASIAPPTPPVDPVVKELIAAGENLRGQDCMFMEQIREATARWNAAVAAARAKGGRT